MSWHFLFLIIDSSSQLLFKKKKIKGTKLLRYFSFYFIFLVSGRDQALTPGSNLEAHTGILAYIWKARSLQNTATE